MRCADDDNRGKQDGRGKAVICGILEVILYLQEKTPDI